MSLTAPDLTAAWSQLTVGICSVGRCLRGKTPVVCPFVLSAWCYIRNTSFSILFFFSRYIFQSIDVMFWCLHLTLRNQCLLAEEWLQSLRRDENKRVRHGLRILKVRDTTTLITKSPDTEKENEEEMNHLKSIWQFQGTDNRVKPSNVVGPRLKHVWPLPKVLWHARDQRIQISVLGKMPLALLRQN